MCRLTLILLAATFTVTVVCCKPDTHAPAESILRMKAECREAGAKTRKEWMQQYPRETFSSEPEYAYSEQLGTCLYADSYSDSGTRVIPGVNVREARFVVDVYANKVILELTLHDGKVVAPSGDPAMCKSELEFIARKAKLFAPVVEPRNK